MVAEGKQGALRIVLAAIAIAATFAIGLLAGREIARPQPGPQDAPAASAFPASPVVAPGLLGYRQLLKIPIGLARPCGIASSPDGTIWVCGDRSLVRLDRTGTVKERFALDGEPTCAALGTGGVVIVGMGDHVEVVDPATGKSTSWADLGSPAIVTSVAAGPSGVYVADAGNRMVLRFDARGRLMGRFDKGFVVPSPHFDVAVAADGTLWAANPGGQSVRHYTPEGELLASWGKASIDVEGFGGCCNPAGIALLPCGAIVTAEKGYVRVKVYETDGSLSSVVAQPADFPAGEVSVDIATRKANGGEILVLVPLEKTVRVYVKKGATGGG